MEQISLFDLNCNELKKIKKPIRLIELFAGVGSQAMALRNVGVEFYNYKVVEFDKYAVCSYNAIHNTAFLPMDITKTTAKDLEIKETDKYEYVVTYSYPCTDLSKAGKMEGMKKGSGTRSGLLWEFERILDECEELPQILLMENVTEVHSKNNIKDFNLWCQKLESLGYHNFYKDMNAKSYGIPQNRNRCFMISLLGDYYYSFPNERELKLRVKDFLKEKVDEKYYISNDMKKYIVGSNEKWTGNNEKSLINKNIASTINTCKGSRRCDASNYICDTVEENYDIKLLQVGNLVGNPYDKMHECSKRVYDSNGVCPTINTCGGGNREPKIIEETLLLDEQNKTIKNDNYVGTIITDGSYPNHNNRVIEMYQVPIGANKGVFTEREVCQTISTSACEHNNFICEKENNENKRFFNQAIYTFNSNKCCEGDIINAFNCNLEKDGISPTITTRPDGFKTAILPVVKDKNYDYKIWGSSQKHSAINNDGICPTLTSAMGMGGGQTPMHNVDLRIRKLTPLECWRLMGFSDEDFYKAKKLLNDTFYKGKDRSNSQLYKQAGNSIVVNVLEEIFNKLF